MRAAVNTLQVFADTFAVLQNSCVHYEAFANIRGVEIG